MEDKKKKGGSFVVRVQHCENATWQGTIVWAEKNITKQFRSVLELLKLMDSALNSSEEE